MTGVQGDLFDKDEGERRKFVGMARALSQVPNFAAKVRILITHLANTRTDFANDDVRKLADELGVVNPGSPNAWGGILNGAGASGEIEWCGYSNSKIPSRQAGKQGRWRKKQ
jgi:hypothetical protein